MARAKTAPARALTEADLLVLLKERFGAPEYAFLPHVRNGTGYIRRVTRTTDALAMGLWPSRGLDLHGFEIKSDRGDWLREKDEPEKAEEIARFCDRWWLVVGRPDIVGVGELPAAWGLLAPNGKGKLSVVKEAAQLDPKPLDRVQLAAILRKAQECVVPKAEIKAELEREYQRGHTAGKEEAKWDGEHARRELKSLQESLAAFEAASGIEITAWAGRRIGEAVKVVMAGGPERVEERLREIHETAQEIAAGLAKSLAALAPADPAKTGTEG